MKTVFFDIDTQIDFLYPAGALYVAGAERIVPAVAELNRYASANGIPVVSTLDTHTEDDPEFKQWIAHCVSGTAGQAKPASTLLEKRVVVPNRPGEFGVEGLQQIVLEKPTVNVFETCTIDGLLAKLQGDRYVLYGVVTEICVRNAALGLLRTGKPVAVVTDAVETLDPASSRSFLEEFTVAGGTLTTVAQVCV